MNNGNFHKNANTHNSLSSRTYPIYNKNNGLANTYNHSNIDNNNNLPGIQNFKTTKFLSKFKNKISVTGRDGFADIIATNSNDKIVNPEISNKPSNAKNLNDWKEALQERKKLYLINNVM